jgi:ABC-type lipoprotein release transport system permease subunit
MLLRLAMRNLWRNGRRTALTMAAIAFGFALAVFTLNLTTGSYNDMIRAGISQQAGHVVVQAAGYQADPDDALRVARASEVVTALAAIDPGAVVTRRVNLRGLVVSPSGSVGAGVVAVDPVAERSLSMIPDRIVDGAWLDDDDRGVLIGRAMADRLGVGVGDKLVYMGQHGGTEVASRLFRVKGIFRTGSADMDGFVAFVHVHAGSELLGAPDTVHQVALHLTEPERAAEATAAARAALSRSELEVLDWRAALPEMGAMIEVDRTSNEFMLYAITLIVAMGVVNTVLMSVLERTREFGVLLAIGVRRRTIAQLVLLEGFVLGVLGTGLGLLLGVALSYPLVTYGLDFSSFMGSEAYDAGGVVISAVIKGAWDVPRIVRFGVLSVLWTVLAAAWPAWRTSRFQPVDAMRGA